MNLDFIKNLLDLASDAYYNGKQLLLSDDQYDRLCATYKYETLGSKPTGNTIKHMWPMWSLKKHFMGEGKLPDIFSEDRMDNVDSKKLDGAAAALYYVNGYFSHAAGRGDGLVGQDITDKIPYIRNIPNLDLNVFGGKPLVQVTGEMVVSKNIANARNYASGALILKDIEEFKTREPIYFYAYGIHPYTSDSYSSDLWNLEHSYGFKTVLSDELEQFNQDGRVVRVNSNSVFDTLGYTNHHPRGAIAIKQRKSGLPTRIKDVVWQVGKSGRVTPVAILEPVNIDGAMVSKATLNNPGFIRALDLHIGDTVEVIRSGDIIPTILGRWENE